MKRVTILTIVAAALLVGCSKPEDKFVGMWDGTMDVPPESIAAANKMIEDLAKSTGQKISEADKKEMQKSFDSIKDVKLTLDMKKDGNCVMVTDANGKATTSTGSWQLSEDKKSITMTMKEGTGVGATQFTQAIVFMIGADGKSMVYENDMMGIKSKLTFAKR